MNKYARIDKLVRKSDMYWFLYTQKNISPNTIASRFGVTVRTVTRGIAERNARKNYAIKNSIYAKRVSQLSWVYSY